MRSLKFVAAGALIGLAGLLSAFAVAAQGAPAAARPADSISLPIPTTVVSTVVPSVPVTTVIPSLPTTTVPSLPTTTVPSLPTSTLPTVPTTTLVTTTTKTTTTRPSPTGTSSGAAATTTSTGGTGANKDGTRTVPNRVNQPSRCRTRGGLPDRRCTPGATNRRLAKRQACGGKGLRTTPLSRGTMERIFAAYGVVAATRSRYRLDRLISGRLGGSNKVANVWPQPTSGALNANQKDRAEAYLLRRVCAGRISLRSAQLKLARNWVAVYRSLGRR
jgi:hypothetical protein